MLKQSVLSFVVGAFWCLSAHAQVGLGGEPPSVRFAFADPVSEVLAPLPLEAFPTSHARGDRPAPMRFGVDREVALGTANAGLWESLADGSRVWTLRIQSPGAVSLSLIFARFELPEGARVWIRGADGEQVLGAFGPEFANADGGFATQPLRGDAVVIEYVEPAQAVGGELQIAQVVHGFRDVISRPQAALQGGAPGTSGACNVDVNCPLGANWQPQKRAVARVFMGPYVCSGSLISNTAQDARQLFLTADHCFEDSPPPSTWLFNFNFDADSCGGSNVLRDDWVGGAALRTRSAVSDHCLLEITQPIPPAFNVYLAGWSRFASAPSRAIGIHHPSGDVKKICEDADPLNAATLFGVPCWRVEEWEAGVTEGGSSGSPLFDSNRHVVGQLLGGAAYCGYVFDDYYGRFDVSWGQGLAPHLDPVGYGEVALHGLEPDCGRPASYCAPKTSSSGRLPHIASAGQASLASNDFTLSLADAEPFKSCILISGALSQQTPFHGGYLCLAAPFVRSAVAMTDAAGRASVPFPLSSAQLGATLHFQFWFRDPAASFGDGLSDALRVQVSAANAPIAPATPTGLVVQSVGPDWVRLAWQDNAVGELSYRVALLSPGEDANNPGHWDNVGGDLPADTTTFTIGGLTQDSTYRFKVRAEGSCGYSLYSAVVSGTPICAVPAAPGSCTATQIGNGVVRVTWSASPQHATGYRVARLNPGEDPNNEAHWDNVGGTLPLSQTQFVDGGVSQLGLYRYKVRATTDCGAYSPYSNIASVDVQCWAPATPGGLTVQWTSWRQVALSWQDLASDEVEYRVSVLDPNEDPNNFGQWDNVGGALAPNTTSYVVGNLFAGSAYRFRVRCKNACGTYSQYTAIVTGTTAELPAPANFLADRITSTPALDVKCYWDPYSGATGYHGIRVARLPPGQNPNNPAAWVHAGTANAPESELIDFPPTTGSWQYKCRAYVDTPWGRIFSLYSNTDTANL